MWRVAIGLALLLAACAPAEHRAVAAACSPDLPASNAGKDQPEGVDGGCRLDSDCIGIQGRCVASGSRFACSFDSQCHSDADCTGLSVCLCEGTERDLRPFCVGSGNCRVDKDCGSGGFCSPSHDFCRGGLVEAFFCHTPKDTCLNDADCQGSGLCMFDRSDQLWRCRSWCY